MSANKLPDLGVRIKTEPGLESERLSSFKLPRDLTLGGQAHRAKRVFAPNVNVARNRNKIEPTLPKSGPSGRNQRGGRGRGDRGRGNDRGRGGRGRGRGDFIQSQGVFSEGIAEKKRTSGWSSRTSSGGGAAKEADMIEKPKLDLKQEVKVDKLEEDKKLEDIFAQKRDYAHLEPDHENGPISLPYRDYKTEFKIKVKVEPGEETTAKFQTSHKVQGLNKVAKNSELPVIDKLPDLLQTDKHKLIFFQFPDSLPAFGNASEPTVPLVKDKKTPESTENTPPVANKCSLQDLDEGLVGKIVIYRSGRAKLFFGSAEFNIELEMHRSFLQDVVAIETGADKTDSSTINLGSIDGGVVVTPDWNYVLNNIP